MEKISLIMFFCLVLIIVQPVALSDDGANLDGNEVCGILSIILIIFVLIIGLFFFISDLKNKHKTRKDENLKYCPNCGREIPLNSEFCQYCGSKID